MIPALAPLFRGPLEPIGDMLALADDPRPSLSMQAYLAPEHVVLCLARFAPHYMEHDRRALVSLWAKYHFQRIVTPVVAASLMLDWRLSVSAQHIRVIMGDDGLPAAFALPDAGGPWRHEPSNGFERFEELFDRHLDVMIRALRDQVKLAPKVFWSSAAHYYEATVQQLATQPIPEQRMLQAQQLLEQTCRPDGMRNPLHNQIRYVNAADRPDKADREPHRRRTHCCIRYKLPGKTLCGTCPHTDNPPADYDPQSAG